MNLIDPNAMMHRAHQIQRARLGEAHRHRLIRRTRPTSAPPLRSFRGALAR